MSSRRHHIVILFDPCTLDAQSQTVQLKKATYQLQYQRNFLSIILECISEYMRIIFDLHPSSITFDLISCGTKIHHQKHITKSDYFASMEQFSSIIGVQTCDQTKFAEGIDKHLSNLPSDLQNAHQHSSPFDSHHAPPITHLIFIARNQQPIENYKYVTNESTGASINFAKLCKSAKIRNASIRNVSILKYDAIDMNIHCRPWKKTTAAAYGCKGNQKEDKEEGEYIDYEAQEDEDDILMIDFDGDKSEIIEFYESITTIDKLHSSLLDLMCDIQFSSVIRQVNIVSVPFKDPQTQVKTSLTIPMVCCIDNIGHSHLYNTMYFAHYERERVGEYENIESLQWCKIPSSMDSEHFDWCDWFTTNIVLISPSKLDDTSRLLMKFINKKKIATLRANYGTKPKPKHENKSKITHCIKLVGMQLYLLTVRYKFPWFSPHGVQLPNYAKHGHNKTEHDHCFKHWMESKNICKTLMDSKPPFVNTKNKLNVMQMNTATVAKSSPSQQNKASNASDSQAQINNFARCKQFVSSSEMTRISTHLLPNAMPLIGKEFTAQLICNTHGNNSNNKEPTNDQGISLFDMFYMQEAK
eukprot:19025_1